MAMEWEGPILAAAASAMEEVVSPRATIASSMVAGKGAPMPVAGAPVLLQAGVDGDAQTLPALGGAPMLRPRVVPEVGAMEAPRAVVPSPTVGSTTVLVMLDAVASIPRDPLASSNPFPPTSPYFLEYTNSTQAASGQTR